MAQDDDDPSFAHMSGGADIMGGFQYGLRADRSDFGDDGRQTFSITSEPSAVFFPRITAMDLVGDGREPDRRPRFKPSIDGDTSVVSSGASYVLSVHGGRGGSYGSIFSSVHDGQTKASRTETSSQAHREMDAAAAAAAQAFDADDDGPQVPDIVTVEHIAAPNIGAADHWNQLGVPPMITGMQASSGTAMAARAAMVLAASRGTASPAPTDTASTARPDIHSTTSDATDEVVTHLPCEFARYEDCEETFPLRRSEAGITAWTDHMVRTHLNQRFPENLGCWFCDQKFTIDDSSADHFGLAVADNRTKIDLYKRRMRHIAQHYLEQGPQATATASPRADADFEAHLIANGIWDPPAGPSGSGDAGARVLSAQHVRPPMKVETQVEKPPRSHRSTAQIVTERARGARSSARQIRHRQ